MKTKTTHTPLPWRHLDCAILSENINMFGNFVICEVNRDGDGTEDEANMDYIALACNAFPALLAMLVELEDHVQRYGGVPRSATRLWDHVRAAIAQAGGSAE